MAERSFKQEVEKLKLGEGAEFHGEGLLAVTKALLQSGVSYVAGYQGAPISHLMDVLADAQDILAENGIRFENSASEATAAATLAASVNYPLRGAVPFKSTVGTNVASDALANLASGGVTVGPRLGSASAQLRRAVDRLRRPPASFVHEQEKVRERWPAAVRWIEEHALNEFFAERDDDIGIIVQGGSYNTLLRVLERLGLADVYGNS